MEFLDIGASAATGGVLGFIGTAMGRIAGYFESRETHAQERQRWAHELEMETLRAQNLSAEQHHALERDTQIAGHDSLRASYAFATAIGDSYRWVGAVRSLVRPVLTPLLWAIYLVVFFAVVNGNASEFLNDDAQGEFIGYFIANIAFAASAATLWWFGDRAAPPRRFSRN